MIVPDQASLAYVDERVSYDRCTLHCLVVPHNYLNYFLISILVVLIVSSAKTVGRSSCSNLFFIVLEIILVFVEWLMDYFCVH